jgi:hypothetical protein
MAVRGDRHICTCSGDHTAPAPDRGVAASAGGSLLRSERDFAKKYDVGYGTVIGAIQRGELPVVRIASRVWIAEGRFILASLGLDSPEALGRFVKAAGWTLPELLHFLNGDRDE